MPLRMRVHDREPIGRGAAALQETAGAQRFAKELRKRKHYENRVRSAAGPSCVNKRHSQGSHPAASHSVTGTAGTLKVTNHKEPFIHTATLPAEPTPAVRLLHSPRHRCLPHHWGAASCICGNLAFISLHLACLAVFFVPITVTLSYCAGLFTSCACSASLPVTTAIFRTALIKPAASSSGCSPGSAVAPCKRGRCGGPRTTGSTIGTPTLRKIRIRRCAPISCGRTSAGFWPAVTNAPISPCCATGCAPRTAAG